MGFIKMEYRGAVGIIRISRPNALNALNMEVLGELDQVIDAVGQDRDIRAVVLTGEGRAFVAGADIAEMQELNPLDAKAFSAYGNLIFLKLEQLNKPTIAAVNGFALGGGCELTLCCDIRIAGDNAKFGQPEVGLGIIPGFGGTQRLPRLIGISRAMELIFTAKTISADEAFAIGLVNRVVPNDAVLDNALDMAQEIAAKAPVAVRQSKIALQHGMPCDLATGIVIESEAFGLCFATNDQKRAMTAFLSKDKPVLFENR